MGKIRPIAIFLPQFHPIAENDKWWGKGFTEWTNVTKAKPLFKGHYQPHLPADLGFYDLRLEEVRIAQAKLAHLYGIYGFCYYHYWFNGNRLLNRPLDDMLKSGEPDFPYMLCWANENWSRRWDGCEDDLLMTQNYSPEDDVAHIRFLAENFFLDNRYIRINNKPMFVVYRPELFPDIEKTLKVWRTEVKKYGIDNLYLCYTQSFNFKVDPESIGFDAAIEFQPDFFQVDKAMYLKENIVKRVLNKLKVTKRKYGQSVVISYSSFVDKMLSNKIPKYKLFRGLTPMWDNHARKPNASKVLHGSTPALYEKWLNHVVSNFEAYSNEENFVFLNAWNEWAEGNHLEPCQKWGTAYLEATKRVVENA